MFFWFVFCLVDIFVHTIMIAYVPFTIFRMLLMWCGMALFGIVLDKICCHKHAET